MTTSPATVFAETSGEEARFRRLYADHGRHVFAYALRRTQNPDDAADVLAETFLVAWRRIHELPVDSGIRAWLYGVARRTLANQRRSGERRRLLHERLRGEVETAIAAQGSAQIRDELRLALTRLDPKDQELLRLVIWEELTPREAGAVVGISPVAARSRLHRARRKLRHELEGAAKPAVSRENLRPEEGQ